MVRGADVDFRDRASRGTSASASTSARSASGVDISGGARARRHQNHRHQNHDDDIYDDLYADADAEATRPDLYAALGVSPSASTDEITAAYRAIALRCHPDRRRGAADAAETAETFKAAAEARRVLCDANRRAFYDAGGSMEEMDVNVDEYVDAFRALFEERFGGADETAPQKGLSTDQTPVKHSS